MSFPHRHKRIHRLLIGAAHWPCLGWVVMSPATQKRDRQQQLFRETQTPTRDMSFPHRHKRIHRLLIGAAYWPCFGWVVMSPATQKRDRQQLFLETQTPTGFLIDTKEYIDYSMVQPAGLVLVELLCCQPCLAVVLQSGVKDKCYCTVYYIPLNSNFKS